jgi:3-isopropylmalate/(R)-2-methylmalate dehydratase small subunit
MECPEAAAAINDGDEVKVDYTTGTITDVTTGQTFQAQPFPEFMQKIINVGGLVNYVNGKKSVNE